MTTDGNSKTTKVVSTQKPSLPVEGRVLIGYTPFTTVAIPGKIIKHVPGDRAVVAVKKEGKVVKYGVSICTMGDHWEKEKGRLLAEKRMNEGFGKIKLNTGRLPEMMEKLGTAKVVLNLLNSLVCSVADKPGDYKRRIGDFELAKVKKAAKIVKATATKKTAPKKVAANKKK